MHPPGPLTGPVFQELADALRDNDKGKVERIIARHTGSAQPVAVNDDSYRKARGVANRDFPGKLPDALQQLLPPGSTKG